jgi:RNA polymerase sigma factor (sigma-70 family)
MTAGHADTLLHHVRRLAAGHGPTPPDRDLLSGYLEWRSQDAFAALVQRHGPMVLAVCQAVLRHRQDAEDAFQATFLVLARKAHSIRRRDGLASWLHGVAYRVARKARTAAARRQAREAQVAAGAAIASADDLSWGEVRAILHAELAVLPERFREPLVLCYLQGLTQDEAALRLGQSWAAVKGRLRRGRELLRRRLERRGLGLAAALGAVALTGRALAAPLAQAAVRAALPAAGEAAPAAAALARGVLGSLVPVKLRVMLAAVLLASAALAGGAALLPGRLDEVPPPAAPPTPPAGLPAAHADRHGDPLPDGAVARLGTVRFNHGDGLNALHFLPDGKTILSEGNGSLCWWDAGSGKERKRLAIARPSFDDQTILSADGKTLTFLGQEFESDTVRVWDLAQAKEVRVAHVGGRRNEISVFRRNALSPDGKLCALHQPKQIRVFDIATAQELYALPNADVQVRAVTFAGSERLVTADKKQVVRVYEAQTGKLIRQFAHGAPAEILSASADGRLLASLEHHTHAIDGLLEGDKVHVWDLTTFTQKHALTARPKRWFMSVQISPDGKLVLAGSAGPDRGSVTVWDVETGRRVRELPTVGQTLAVSRDGGQLVEGAQPGKLERWDLKTGRRLSGEDSQHARAAGVFLSPRGERALTIGYASFSTWDARTGRRLHSFDLPPFPSSDPRRLISPDGRYAVTFTGDYQRVQILIWDVAAGRLLHTLRPPDSSSQIRCAFAPDSSLLATWHPAKENVVHLWDVQAGKEVRSFPERRAGWPGRLFFAADGKTLFVAGRRTAGYDITSGKELFSWRMEPLPNNSGVKTAVAGGGAVYAQQEPLAWRTFAVAPDGRTAACILTGEDFGGRRTEDRIVLCEARTGKVLRRWNDSGKASRWWEQLCFSDDSRLLASSDGEVVHVWEAATGGKVRSFRGHRGEIQSLAFSDNGRRLASASWDSTVLIWDLAPAEVSPGKPGAKEVAAWWADLAGGDAALAHAALWRLADSPDASVPLLRRHLQPVGAADMEAIRRHLAELGSDAFAVREQAFKQLKRLGQAAAPALRAELDKKASLETRRRVELLLDTLRDRPQSGESLRTLRALAVLEHAGRPEARQLLEALAGGAAEAWLTQEAQAVRARLSAWVE